MTSYAGFTPEAEAPHSAILERAAAWLFTLDVHFSAPLVVVCNPFNVGVQG